MDTVETRPKVQVLLEGVTTDEMKRLGVEALRRWWSDPRRQTLATNSKPMDGIAEIFQVHDQLARQLIELLARRKVYTLAPGEVDAMKEAFIDCVQLGFMRPFFEFECWLERAGLAVVLQWDRGAPSQMRLTHRGMLALVEPDDHPLLPGFLERVQTLCPGIPDGVIALLVDARACLNYSLLRAAVVLMGVAYEIAIAEVADRLHNKNIFGLQKPVSAKQAGEKIELIKKAIAGDKIPSLNAIADKQDRAAHAEAAAQAYDFADSLRRRRNEASHLMPVHDFDHTGETEEFLVSAGRHLRALWSVALEP